MKPPAELKDRVTFQRKAVNGDGDRLGAWTDVVTRPAEVRPLKGGEGVQAQRLEGSQPVLIIVRRERLTRDIDNSYRAVDAHEVARRVREGQAADQALAAATKWGVTSAIFNRADDTMEFLAVQRRGGSDV